MYLVRVIFQSLDDITALDESVEMLQQLQSHIIDIDFVTHLKHVDFFVRIYFGNPLTLGSTNIFVSIYKCYKTLLHF